MKKIVMPIVAAVLMISSVLFTPTAIVPVVSVGAGNGENTMVLEVEELIPVIDFVTSKKYSSNADNDDAPSIDDGTLVNKSSEHTSAMLIEETQMYMTEEVLSEYKQVISMNRSLTMAFTEDASYYVSKGSCKYIYRDYDDSGNSEEYYIVTDLSVYIDDEQTLINIKKFDVTGDYLEIGDLTEYLGQWIRVPNKIAIELLEMVDEMNQTFFDNLKGYVEKISEGKDKKIYEFSDTMISKDDTQVTIDISDPETPYVNIILEYSEDSNSLYMNDTISFFNIDNSVIKINTNNVKELDEEEFEKIFMGE